MDSVISHATRECMAQKADASQLLLPAADSTNTSLSICYNAVITSHTEPTRHETQYLQQIMKFPLLYETNPRYRLRNKFIKRCTDTVTVSHLSNKDRRHTVKQFTGNIRRAQTSAKAGHLVYIQVQQLYSPQLHFSVL